MPLMRSHDLWHYINQYVRTMYVMHLLFGPSSKVILVKFNSFSNKKTTTPVERPPFQDNPGKPVPEK